MSRNILETVMGAIVLAVAGWFFYTVYQGRDIADQVGKGGYQVSALFDNAAGISTGSDVRVGGVKVGVVSDMALDASSYRAKISLLLSELTKMPEDSSASIVSDGLLGSKFVSLTPGASDVMLKDGDKIEYTQSAVSLEELIGKFVFSAGGVDKETDESSSPEDKKSDVSGGDDEDLELTLP